MEILLYPMVDGYPMADGRSRGMVFSFEPIDLTRTPGVEVDRKQFFRHEAPPPYRVEVPPGSTLEGTLRVLAWHEEGKIIRSEANEIYTFALTGVRGFRLVH